MRGGSFPVNMEYVGGGEIVSSLREQGLHINLTLSDFLFCFGCCIRLPFCFWPSACDRYYSLDYLCHCRSLMSCSCIYHCSPTRHAALGSPVVCAIFRNETCSVMKDVLLKSELAYASVCHFIVLYCRHSHTWEQSWIAPPLPENNYHLVSMWIRLVGICAEWNSHINE